MKEYYPDITIKLYAKDWQSLDIQELSFVSLREWKEKLEKLHARTEDFMSHAWKIAEEEDEFLRYEDYLAIEAAYDRMYKVYQYVDEAIDCVDDAIEQWDGMERNLRFVFLDTASVVKNAV